MLAIFVTLGSLPGSSLAADVAVDLRLEPSLVGLDEIATLTIEATGDGIGSFKLAPEFELENLQIVAGPHRSQNFRFVNGKASRSESLTWQLSPRAVGTARVHAVRVAIRDEILVLEEAEIEIQEDPVAPRGRTSSRPYDPFDDFFDPSGRDRARPFRPAEAEPQVFLRSEVSPDQPFVGQQVLYTIYLYSQADVVAVNPEELPDFAGFWARDLPTPEQPRTEMVEIEGERFARVALLRRALFPLRAEALTIDPAVLRLGLRLPDRGFFGPMMSHTEEVRRRTKSTRLHVKPLPSDPPPGFHGAVGSLTMEASLDPVSVHAGEAATLTLTLSGPAYAEGLPDPELPPLEDVKIYPPQRNGSTRFKRTTLNTNRSWSYVLVPHRAGTWTLPSIAIPYFDPEVSDFRTASSLPMELHATTAVDAPAPSPESVSEPAAAISRDEPAGIPTLWLVGGAIILIVGLGTVALRRVFSSKTHRAASRRLSRRLAETTRIDGPRRAAVEIEEAWREYLADRWQVRPGSASTTWESQLADRNANQEAASELASLADDLHYLRYAPELSAADALREELVDRSRRLAKLLR